MRYINVLATLLLVISISAAQPVGQPSRASNSSSEKPASGLSTLPADAQAPISAALGRDNSEYWAHPQVDGFRVENSRQALATQFTRQGTEVRSHNLAWAIEMRAYGYGNALQPVNAVAPTANDNRVEYRRDAMTEWYENGPLGLEQGFTLSHRPANANGQPLTLELALRGDLTPSLEPGSSALELRAKDGKAVLRYSGLKARDAAGQELRSWLEVNKNQMFVRVDDTNARYPVVVDPWIQQAELTASDGAEDDFFGYSVAVDGAIAVVGAPNHTTSGTNQFQGSAYVFVQNGTTWSQQAELTGPTGTDAQGGLFGQAVAVSGSLALVGAPSITVGTNASQGAAFVFVQSGSAWSQQAQLTASDGAAGDQFGESVAIAGATAVVGAQQFFSNGPGAAYVYVQSGTTWNQQGKLTASDGKAGDWLGTSVAVVGSTALVGSPNHPYSSNTSEPGPGSAYVFVESGKTWSQQAELNASDAVAGDAFGTSVALTSSSAVAGAPLHTVGANSNQGAAYVFASSGDTWNQQAELTSSDGASGDAFGASVGLSGSTLVVGAFTKNVGSNASQGAAYVFSQSGTTWSQQVELTSSDGAADDYFGFASAISGSTAVVGANGHTVSSHAGQGAAYVFVPSTTAVTISPASLSFANEPVNNTSAAKSVTVKNGSTSTLDISKVDITPGTNFKISNNTCGTTLDAGKTCKVSVEFEPTALGALTASLAFTDNAPGSPQSVALSGTGTADAALTPTKASFAKTAVGATSAAKTFTLANDQSAELSDIAISVTGDFAVSKTTCGSTLTGKSKCTVSVVFKPTASGASSGTLEVKDSANNSPQTSTLTGTGK